MRRCGTRRRVNSTESGAERCDQGVIIRTHLLRPTWHFVAPADVRWLLRLTAARVHARNAYMYRKLGLDGATLRRSDLALARALKDGQHLTRDDLRVVLRKANIAFDGTLGMSYIMMHAELESIVCSGPRRGKQFTYALLDERVQSASTLTRDEALAELAQRYFRSRGPATIADFAKWSGLTTADARRGLAAVKAQFELLVFGGESYWFTPSASAVAEALPGARLLSVYDELISSYRNHDANVPAAYARNLAEMGNALTHVIVMNGQVIGAWKPALSKAEVSIRTNVFRSLTKAEDRALALACRRYAKFLGLRVVRT